MCIQVIIGGNTLINQEGHRNTLINQEGHRNT